MFANKNGDKLVTTESKMFAELASDTKFVNMIDKFTFTVGMENETEFEMVMVGRE